MVDIYVSMKKDELTKFLAEVSRHINRPNPRASLSFGDLDLRGGLSINLTPGNRLHIVLEVHEAVCHSTKEITVTVGRIGDEENERTDE